MIIKPYGDTLNDGAVQLSFTLPVQLSPRADEAARQYAKQLGFEECEVVHSAALADDFSFFVVYGKTTVGIDFDAIQVVEAEKSMDFYEVNDFVEKNIGRKVVVVGACIGFDAHTVGIDAIMNMKGYEQHYGLERYKMFEAYNLGSQVSAEALIAKATEKKADAILVSQIVTQKDSHIKNLTEFVELLEAENKRTDFIIIAGGPRISNKLAMELGFDAGFGRGTYPEDVASYIVKKMFEKK